jgi:hypothetical protein
VKSFLIPATTAVIRPAEDLGHCWAEGCRQGDWCEKGSAQGRLAGGLDLESRRSEGPTERKERSEEGTEYHPLHAQAVSGYVADPGSTLADLTPKYDERTRQKTKD